MIVDLDQDPAGAPDGHDVLVVGSGPAGTSLACECAAAGLSVCVLESGLARPTTRGDRLREVDSEGIVIKDRSRERVLGGASTTWAGLSSPLDPPEFDERPWQELPGWPIAREELLPFWREAARYRFAPLELFAPSGFGRLRGKGDLAPQWSGLVEKTFLAAAEPQDFGREWRALFEESGRDLVLDATVVRLETEREGGRVVAAVARSRGGVERRFSARAVVLACGGIENARLLLLSGGPFAEGPVGRGLMNHPKRYAGRLHLAQPVRHLPYYFGCLHEGFAGYAGLRLPDEVQRERELVEAYVRFEPLYPWSDRPGVEALVTLVKGSGGLFRNWKERRRDEVVELRDWSETGDDSDLQNERRGLFGTLALGGLIARDAPAVARYAWSRLRTRGAPPVDTVRLRNFMEMEPRLENRVELSGRRDELGTPLPRVVHFPSERDRRSLVELHATLADEVRRLGMGQLESDLASADPWPIVEDASHHMGTTRMGRDPVTSVVDPDARHHRLENLYCAGASLFPTSGVANPTFTIVALSIRLARHLAHALGGASTAHGGGGASASSREGAA